MDHLIKEEIIFNSLNNFAIIYQVEKGFKSEVFLRKAAEKYPKLKFRVYFWIDDVKDSLDEKTIEKFENLFKISGLACAKAFDGNVFLIDTIKIDLKNTEEIILEPRQGQDGGVLGITGC